MDVIVELCGNNCVIALFVSVFVVSLAAAIYILNGNKSKPPSLKKTQEKIPSNNQKGKKSNDFDSLGSEIKGIKKVAVKKVTVLNGNVISSNSDLSRNATESVKKVASLNTKSSKRNSPGSNNGDVKAMQSKLKVAKQSERNDFVDTGEWQTVLTKKQKKKQLPDLLIQVVADVASAAASIPKAAKHKTFKREKKLTLLTKSATEPTKSPIVLAPATVSEKSLGSISIEPPVDSIHLQSKSTFDKLSDTEWKETTLRKKSKRRALKE